MRLGKILSQFERAIEGQERVIEALEIAQDVAAVVVCFGKAAVQVQRAIE